MAFAKWPDTIDAIVNEDQTTSADGSQITVTAKAIKFDSSVDRDALHHMNDEHGRVADGKPVATSDIALLKSGRIAAINPRCARFCW